MKVPEPRKLKSGNYFIQLRLNGVSVPVTASSAKECKRQAQLIKAEHMAGKREIQKTEQTIGDLIDKFTKKYESSLSPTTIRTYDGVRRNRFKAYMDRPYRDIKDWQSMINEELKVAAKKTVRTAWGAVTTALTDAGYNIPKVKLPRPPQTELTFLEPEEIPLFLEAAKGDDAEIEILLELHGLRVSETMYVVRNRMIDLKHNVINVRGAIVPNKDNKYVQKDTNKTKASTRTVPIMIPRLAELVGEYQSKGKEIPTHTESTLLKHIHAICDKAGVTDVTNHGLRRTFASVGYSTGVSELALQQMGGWDDAETMRKIYIKLAARDKKRAENAMADFYKPKTDEIRYEEAVKKLESICSEYSDLTKLAGVFDAVKMLNTNG